MTAEALLSRLQRVRRAGNGRWSACCPAHPDRHPSLGVRELADGTVLVRCHARQCVVSDILAAVGLELHDLFPARAPSDHRRPPERHPWRAHDVLAAVVHEAFFVSVVATDMARGKTLTPATRRRLLTAASRLSAAEELVNGR